MAKATTRKPTKAPVKPTKAPVKPGKPTGKPGKPSERFDKVNRVTPFTIRYNQKADPKAPVKITGTQGAGHGMTYAVTFPGAKETVGITRALVILGYAGFDRASCRAMCDLAGQPEIRDLVIARYAGAGRGQADGKPTGQISNLSASEKALVGAGKKALAYYMAKAGK